MATQQTVPHSIAQSKSPIELRVKSFTRRGITYNVRYSNRQWTCTCPAARYRQRACKHVQLLRVLGVRRAVRLAESEAGQ